MKIRNFFLAALAILTLGAGPAFAQTSVIIRKPDNSGAQVDIGAQVSPFKPTGNATLALTTASARVALPSADTTVVVRNTGATDASINLGNSSVTAATTNFLLPAGSTAVLSAVGSTHIAGITASSTSSLAISTGTGTPSFQAAAGAGGGGGGAVTNAGTFAVQNTAGAVASENHVGEVGGNQLTVQVAQTVTASSAYASGNAVGGLITISNAARVSASAGSAGTGGMLQSVIVNSKSTQTMQVDFFLFSANPSGSTCTDKTAFSLASADFDKVLGVVSVVGANWFSGGTASIGQAQNLAMPYALASSTTLYACAVTRGTPTFSATSDISLGFRLLRN